MKSISKNSIDVIGIEKYNYRAIVYGSEELGYFKEPKIRAYETLEELNNDKNYWNKVGYSYKLFKLV